MLQPFFELPLSILVPYRPWQGFQPSFPKVLLQSFLFLPPFLADFGKFLPSPSRHRLGKVTFPLLASLTQTLKVDLLAIPRPHS